MAFIPAPNCVEVVLRFLWNAQTVAITLSFCRNDSVSTGEMDALATELQDWWNAELKPLMSQFISLSNINITDLTTDSAPSIDYPYSSAGTNTNGTWSNSTALVTKFGTDQRGRSYRGRVYVPGLPSDATANGVSVTGTRAAAQTTAFAALPSYVNPIGWQHVVISRRHNNADRVTAVSTPITSYSTEIYLDSQRRRLAGRGV